MLENLKRMKKQLSDLATVLNSFKSEAVQLRLLEYLMSEQSAAKSNGKPGRNRTSKKIKSPTAQKATGRKAAAKKRGKSPKGMGGQAALTNLLSTPFFTKPRTIKDIVKYCKQKFGRTFKQTDFSGRLSRLAATGELERKKNAENKYEYTKPKK